jgi:acyl-homoserine-lactone acylase
MFRIGGAPRAGVVCAAAVACAALAAAQPRFAYRLEITRDTFGVPHILSDSEGGVGFGLGYAQAEDHIEAIARQVLEARGESARWFGRSEMTADFAMKRVANLDGARRRILDLDANYRAALEGFAAGVNLYVSQHRSELPEWVPQVTPADFLAVPRAGSVRPMISPELIRALDAKYRGRPTLGPRTGAMDSAASLIGDDEAGSNALALAGGRTVSGHPILLGNPHLRWSSLYWEAHVRIPGRLNFYGSTLAGLPWLRAGFNERIAYVQTNNDPDLADIYALPLDRTRPDRYMFEGKSRELLAQDLTIDVLQDDGAVVPERQRFWVSHLGPIIHRTDAFAFAYRSSALDAWRMFEGFWRLSHARNLKEFRSVMARQLMPSSNYTYADAEGNIFYFWNARLPRRAEGTSYELDVPGEKQFVWSKLHDADELPQLLNPPGGVIQNANNPPWFVSTADAIPADDYPSYVERGELGLRPQLALEMLASRDKFSPDAVRAMKFSPRLLLAERVRDDLLAAADAVKVPSLDLAEGRDIIAAWDSTASADASGAVLFERFWDRYEAAVPQPFAQAWDAARPFETPYGLADRARAAAELEQAVRDTRAAYGAANVRWGYANRFRFGDVDLPADGASGRLGAYRVQRFDPGEKNLGIAGRDATGEMHGFGDAWVLLVHFTRPIEAMSILAYGQSSRPGAAHGSDQIRPFAAHQLRPVWFYPADIAAHTERKYRP